MRPHFVPLAFALLFSPVACNAADSNGAGQQKPEAPAALGPYPGAAVEMSNGDLWFSRVIESPLRYDGKTFHTYTTEDGLASNMIRDFLEREPGVIWMATGSGVCVFDGESFTTLDDYGDAERIQTNSAIADYLDVWDLHVDRKGVFWIATMAGLFREQAGVWVPFPLPVSAPRGAYEFAPKMVYSIYEDAEGDLWFGTDGAGVVRFDGKDMTVYTTKDGLASDRVCSVLQDRTGTYWFGTSGGGVSRLKDGVFTTHLRSATFSEHTGWGRYMDIVEDPHGILWFGKASTNGGVDRFDGETFENVGYGVEAGTGRPRQMGSGASLSLDSSGALWIGSTNGVFRQTDAGFEHFTRGD